MCQLTTGMSYLIVPFRWLAIGAFVVLRVLNLLEPPEQGSIPVRDYLPILSWSKIARVVGLVLVVVLVVTGAGDLETLIGLLTYAGGEAGYRFRQWNNTPDAPGTQLVDNPDQEQ